MPSLARCLVRGAALAALALAFAASARAQDALQKPVSIDADDTGLPSVLKILADKGGLNIVTGPGVATGRITIHMKDVPIDQAVNLVVRAAGLAYERIGNSILVADAKSLQTETGLSAYTVTLKYADANEVKEALKNLTDQIQVDAGGNRLIVVTSPRIISEIQEIVAELDRPARQVMLEARVVEVSTDDAKKLGVDWDLLNRNGFTFVEGTTSSGSGSGGIEPPGEINPTYLFPNTPGTDDIWRFKNFTRFPVVFRAFVDLMIQQGNARVLANPKLVTLNGKTANMLVGQRIPFLVSQTVFAGGGAAPTQTVQKEEVGVKLAITPIINADGYITTTIEPEVSSVTGFKGQNADLPIIATRQASTTVRLKDGGSVIIGGLLSEDRTVNTSKVPLLGEIPGFGLLFQHQSVTAHKTDLVIEVTPHILPDQP